jgi:hypothetical protein
LELTKILKASFQGCQMVYFQTINPNLGKFWSALQCKMLVNFMVTWSFLLTLRIFYWVYFVVVWVYFFPLWYVVPGKIWQPCFFSPTSVARMLKHLAEKLGHPREN